MGNLADIIDREMMEQDSNKLRSFEKDIKETSLKYYDELHSEFICENENLTFEDILLIKKVFDFLKDKI